VQPFWRRIPQTFRIVAGAAIDALAIVIFLFSDAPALTGLPSVFLAAIFTAIGTLALVSVILDKDDEIATLEARLEDRAKRQAGIHALDERIEEGNELARRLRRYRSIPEEGMDAAREAMGAAVGEWNERCVSTANEYLGVAGRFGSQYPSPMTPQDSKWYWRENLFSEVTTKSHWLYEEQVRLRNNVEMPLPG
jgi:hypothetical protein